VWPTYTCSSHVDNAVYNTVDLSAYQSAQTFNAMQAMCELGRAEYKAETA
jgi:hypothetical protein